jgi:hypothetical protein
MRGGVDEGEKSGRGVVRSISHSPLAHSIAEQPIMTLAVLLKAVQAGFARTSEGVKIVLP